MPPRVSTLCSPQNAPGSPKSLLLQEDFLTLPRPQSRINTPLLYALNDSVDVSITETFLPLCICSSQPSGFQDSRDTVPILLISVCPGPSTVPDTWRNSLVNWNPIRNPISSYPEHQVHAQGCLAHGTRSLNKNSLHELKNECMGKAVGHLHTYFYWTSSQMTLRVASRYNLGKWKLQVFSSRLTINSKVVVMDWMSVSLPPNSSTETFTPMWWY